MPWGGEGKGCLYPVTMLRARVQYRNYVANVAIAVSARGAAGAALQRIWS
jgi:hypothetical protein